VFNGKDEKGGTEMNDQKYDYVFCHKKSGVGIGVMPLPGRKKHALVVKNSEGFDPVAYFNSKKDALIISDFLKEALINNDLDKAFQLLVAENLK
jgi:hypothetical protein